MTGHWEFTYGMARVKETKLPLLAQNVRTTDFEDPVFDAYALRELSGVPVAIIGQAFPYTPIANPRYFVPEWTFGIQEARLQVTIDEARGKGAKAVVLLSTTAATSTSSSPRACADSMPSSAGTRMTPFRAPCALEARS